MNLKQITSTGLRKVNACPSIHFGRNSGKIHFNSPSAEFLDLHEGDYLTFFRSNGYPFDWYFSKINSFGSLKLTTQNSTLLTHSRSIVREILSQVGLNETGYFEVESKKVDGKYWKVLTDRAIRS